MFDTEDSSEGIFLDDVRETEIRFDTAISVVNMLIAQYLVDTGYVHDYSDCLGLIEELKKLKQIMIKRSIDGEKRMEKINTEILEKKRMGLI